MTEVVNINYEYCDVFIGRPSKWGNPFKIGTDGTRTEVIKLYRKHVIDSGLINDIGDLRDKKLGCFCKPKACHGDVLVELCNDNLELDIMEL